MSTKFGGSKFAATGTGSPKTRLYNYLSARNILIIKERGFRRRFSQLRQLSGGLDLEFSYKTERRPWGEFIVIGWPCPVLPCSVPTAGEMYPLRPRAEDGPQSSAHNPFQGSGALHRPESVAVGH